MVGEAMVEDFVRVFLQSYRVYPELKTQRQQQKLFTCRFFFSAKEVMYLVRLSICWLQYYLTLTMLVTTIDALGHVENRVITAQCEGIGEVGSARYEPALLPPCPSIRALCYSNCQRSTQSHQQSNKG